MFFTDYPTRVLPVANVVQEIKLRILYELADWNAIISQDTFTDSMSAAELKVTVRAPEG